MPGAEAVPLASVCGRTSSRFHYWGRPWQKQDHHRDGERSSSGPAIPLHRHLDRKQFPGYALDLIDDHKGSEAGRSTCGSSLTASLSIPWAGGLRNSSDPELRGVLYAKHWTPCALPPANRVNPLLPPVRRRGG